MPKKTEEYVPTSLIFSQKKVLCQVFTDKGERIYHLYQNELYAAEYLPIADVMGLVRIGNLYPCYVSKFLYLTTVKDGLNADLRGEPPKPISE